mmetsp:Transcript_45915/g.109355  ORF Transcript_45915/g.109355 Transcript_45915/m.109355 type:complete len:231 (+) Transcript_45915:605-1297(+)
MQVANPTPHWGWLPWVVPGHDGRCRRRSLSPVRGLDPEHQPRTAAPRRPCWRSQLSQAHRPWIRGRIRSSSSKSAAPQQLLLLRLSLPEELRRRPPASSAAATSIHPSSWQWRMMPPPLRCCLVGRSRLPLHPLKWWHPAKTRHHPAAPEPATSVQLLPLQLSLRPLLPRLPRRLRGGGGGGGHHAWGARRRAKSHGKARAAPAARRAGWKEAKRPWLQGVRRATPSNIH